jgi:SPP1 gp7 family putative phage head morphogenesis protein
MTDSRQFINDYISHFAKMSEYGNYFSSEIKGIVDDYLESCEKILKKHKSCFTKVQCNKCKKELKKLYEQLEEEISSFISNQTTEMVEKENKWLSKSVADFFNVKFLFKDSFLPLLLLVPIFSAGSLGDFGETLRKRVEDFYNKKIMTSYISGISFEDMKDSFASNESALKRGVEVDSETLGSSIAGQYDRIVYTNNNFEIKGYIWSAILDTSTCLVCGELDGRKFTKISDAPVYPVHSRCRCVLIPYTENTESSIPNSYSQWFESQSKSDKRKILGKSRFELYENGIKIKSFVNNGKVTPLKDL